MIAPLLTQVAGDQPHVEIPALTGRPAAGDLLARLLRERDGRHAGGHAQALLGSGVAHVDPDRVHLDGHTAQRRHRVDQEQRRCLPQERPDLRKRLMHAGRRLRVNERHHRRLGSRPHGRHDGLFRDDATPIRLDRGHRCAHPPRHLRQPCSEDPVDPHEHLVARLDHVDQRRLHGGRSRSGHGEGQRVLRAVDGPQPDRDVIHEIQKLAVEMPHRRMGHGSQHALGHRRGSGSQEESAFDLGSLHL